MTAVGDAGSGELGSPTNVDAGLQVLQRALMVARLRPLVAGSILVQGRVPLLQPAVQDLQQPSPVCLGCASERVSHRNGRPTADIRIGPLPGRLMVGSSVSYCNRRSASADRIRK